MGLKITTDGKPVTVVRQDKTSSQGNAYTQYSVMISSKNTDGTWVNDFIDCSFKKGTNIVNKTKIHINNAFFLPLVSTTARSRRSCLLLILQLMVKHRSNLVAMDL